MNKSADNFSPCFANKHLRLKRLFTPLLLTLIISPSAMASGIYKWVDEDGKIQYGSERPGNATSERLNINIDKPTKSRKEIEKEEEEDEDEETEAAPLEKSGLVKKSKKEKALACKDAKSRLQTIQSHGRIREFDEKGDSVILPEEARQQRISTAKKMIKKNCR